MRIIVPVLFALAALALGSVTLYEVSTFGFPDGHITEYQRAASLPLTMLSCLLVLGASLFLFFSLRRGKRVGVVVSLIFAALVLLAVTVLLGIPWYFGSYPGLENGAGG